MTPDRVPSAVNDQSLDQGCNARLSRFRASLAARPEAHVLRVTVHWT